MSDKIDVDGAEKAGADLASMWEVLEATTAPKNLNAGVDQLADMLEKFREELPLKYAAELNYTRHETRDGHPFLEVRMHTQHFHLSVVQETLGELSPAFSGLPYISPDQVIDATGWRTPPDGEDIAEVARKRIEQAITDIVSDGGVDVVRTAREIREAKAREAREKAEAVHLARKRKEADELKEARRLRLVLLLFAASIVIILIFVVITSLN